MTRRPFIPWPDERLRTPASFVEELTPDITAIWDEMVETMDAMPGYGLAAPQIGISLRLAVVDCSTERGQAIRMANPEIVEASEDLHSWDEASPNLPGVSARLERPAKVKVAFLSEDGAQVTQEFADLWATSVQHQIDHLNGRMFFDALSATRRQMLLKKARKQRR